MVNIGSNDTLSMILTSGIYLGVIGLIITMYLIIKQVFVKDFQKLKITFLYLINSTLSSIIGYIFIMSLGLIVVAPFGETKEETIKNLQENTMQSLYDFTLISILALMIFSILNILYLKYFAKTKAIKHTLILLLFNTLILMFSIYISLNWYYFGFLNEII
jgi:hypothetical protein